MRPSKVEEPAVRGGGVRVPRRGEGERPRAPLPQGDGRHPPSQPRGRGQPREADRGRRAGDRLRGRRGCSIALADLFKVGGELKVGEVQVRDVIKDLDEDSTEEEEKAALDKVLRIVQRIRKTPPVRPRDRAAPPEGAA